MSDTPLQVRPDQTHDEMVASLRKLREKSGLTALVEAVNRADLGAMGAIVPGDLADPVNQAALRLSTSRDDALSERSRAAERERIRLELLAEASKVAQRTAGAPHGQLYNEAYEAALRDFARRLEPKV